ncbi:MAG: hypothetical protein QFB86_01720 [Patescibacteria group bacterium]|nr:hypothetical protein [Patescibacteria group bacterium]
MTFKKFRWSKVYESSEHELLELLKTKNIAASRVAYDEFEERNDEKYDQDSQLWCVEGSMLITVEEVTIKLQAGDALVVPSVQKYNVAAGLAGCVVFVSAAPTNIMQDDAV